MFGQKMQGVGAMLCDINDCMKGIPVAGYEWPFATQWDAGAGYFVRVFLHFSVSSVGVSGTRLSCLIKQQGQHLLLMPRPSFSATLSLRRLFFVFMPGYWHHGCYMFFSYMSCKLQRFLLSGWSSGGLVFFGK